MPEDQSPQTQPSQPTKQTQIPPTSQVATPITSDKQPPKPPTGLKKKLIAIGAIVLLLLGIAIVFLPIPYYIPGDKVQCLLTENCPKPGWNLGPSLLNRLLNRTTSSFPQEESYSSTPAPETNNKPSGSIETSNWESFASSGHFNNLDNEFQIKYPKTLREDYSDGPFGSSVLLYKEGFELDISISSKQDSINSETDIASKFIQDTINHTMGMGFNCNLLTSCNLKDFSTNVININRNTTAGSVKGPGRSENSVSEAYIVLTGSKSIQLLFHLNNDYENRTIRDQILSTFRFLDNSKETVNWKTYTNTELGILFEHPSYFEVYDKSIKTMVYVRPSDSMYKSKVPPSLFITSSNLPPNLTNLAIGQKYFEPTDDTFESKKGDYANFKRTENVTIANTSAYMYTGDREGVPHVIYIIPKEEIYIVLELKWGTVELGKNNLDKPEFSEDFDQILSTFQFIE